MSFTLPVGAAPPPRDARTLRRSSKGGAIQLPSSSYEDLTSPRAICGRRGSVQAGSPLTSSRHIPAIGGRYRESRRLGHGAHSCVFAARDIKTGARVALKRVNKLSGKAVRTTRNEVDMYLHVMREVRACERPNLVSLEDIVETDEHLYLVLEKMPGDLLELPLQNGAISEDDTRWIFRDVVAALLQLKAAGVAHRDVKPENILIDLAAQRAKLADLGLSSRKICPKTGRTSRATSFVGTRMYAAPEVVAKQGAYDAFQADLYSLGVTLYCIHTRAPPDPEGPFPDFSFGAAAALSAELQDLITWLTVGEPGARIALEAISAHPWLRRRSLASSASSWMESDECL